MVNISSETFVRTLNFKIFLANPKNLVNLITGFIIDNHDYFYTNLLGEGDVESNSTFLLRRLLSEPPKTFV